MTEIVARFQRVCRKDDPMQIAEACPNMDFLRTLLKLAKRKKYLRGPLPPKEAKRGDLEAHLIYVLTLSSAGTDDDEDKTDGAQGTAANGPTNKKATKAQTRKRGGGGY